MTKPLPQQRLRALAPFIEAIEENGGRLVAVEKRKGSHVALVVECGGRQTKVFCSSNGSYDPRALKNFRAVARRLLKASA
jgi:hypothetical protein